jgi:hypothetical protein
MGTHGDWAHTAHQRIYIPDNELKKVKSTYTLVPTRGYASSLAVFNNNGSCIGWISIATLGYPDVATWMTKTKYKDRGY